MKINFKFLAVLFILIALCGIVSADGVLNASTSGAQGYAFTTAVEGTSDTTFAVYLNNVQYLTNLNYISTSWAKITFTSYNANNVKSWSSPATLNYGGNVLCNGILSYSFVYNGTSTTISYYNIQFVPSSPLTNITGLSGQIAATISVASPLSPWPVSQYNTGNAGTAPSVGTTCAYFTGYTHLPVEAYYPYGSVASSWQYIFINSVNIVNNAGSQTTVSINRIFNVGSIPTGFYSTVVVNDSLGSPYFAQASTNNQVFSFNPPQIITIIDPNTGAQWQGVYNYANISLTAPTLNSTINTPLSLSLSSSTGILPSDIGVVEFYTDGANAPNSINDGKLYDNNATIRHPLNFMKRGGIWYQDDGTSFNINVGASLPSSFTTIFLRPNTYHVYCSFQSTLIPTTISNTLTFKITGSSNLAYAYFTINDQRTGSIISNANLALYDNPNQHWTNYTMAAGNVLLALQSNYYYTYQGSANNYISSPTTLLVLTGNQTIPINLLPSNMNIVTGNTTLSVTAEDSGTYAPISGATVSVSNTNQTSGYAYSQSLVTSSSGLALFTVPNNQVYTANVQATGYQAGSSIVSVGTNAAMSLIYLTPVSAIPTVTSIITVQTTVPLGIGNSTSGSSGINGDGKCSATMPSSFLGAIYNFLACEGVTTQAGENIICAIGLLMVLLYVGGRYGGGLGAVIGAASGYVMDLLIGWLPLWTLIAFIVIAALILSAKIFLSSE